MKKIIKKIHLYLALILCLPLIIQGLTGATLVFEREILTAKNIPAVGKKYEVSAIISAAQEKIPEGFVVNFIKFDEAATIRFSKKTPEKNSILEVKIDPVSLEILQIKNPQEDFFYYIKKIHTNLLIQGPTGRNIIGCYGFVMIFMALSGLILWWPKRESLRRALTFKFSSTGKKFHRDLHSAIGFWAAAIILISSFSGVYLAFPQATGNFIAMIFHGKNFTPANEIKITPGITKPLTTAEVIALAQEDGELISIAIPTKPDQPYRLNFAPKNYEEGAPLITIFIDQWQQKIIEKRDPEFYSSAEKIISWQHSLHVGQGLGMIWKIVIFCTGLLPLFFAITGISMWLLKRKK